MNGLTTTLGSSSSVIFNNGIPWDNPGRHPRGIAENFRTVDQRIDDLTDTVTTGVRECMKRYGDVDEGNRLAHCLVKVANPEAIKICAYGANDAAGCTIGVKRRLGLAEGDIAAFDLPNFETDVREVTKQNAQDYRESVASRENRKSELDFLKQAVSAENRGSSETIIASLDSNSLEAWKKKAYESTRVEASERLGLLRERYMMEPASMDSPAFRKVRRRLAQLLHDSGSSQQRSDEMLKAAAVRLAKEHNRG